VNRHCVVVKPSVADAAAAAANAPAPAPAPAPAAAAAPTIGACQRGVAGDEAGLLGRCEVALVQQHTCLGWTWSPVSAAVTIPAKTRKQKRAVVGLLGAAVAAAAAAAGTW
jgi:hypothetical protein